MELTVDPNRRQPVSAAKHTPAPPARRRSFRAIGKPGSADFRDGSVFGTFIGSLGFQETFDGWLRELEPPPYYYRCMVGRFPSGLPIG
jgi:hypothetical protein